MASLSSPPPVPSPISWPPSQYWYDTYYNLLSYRPIVNHYRLLTECLRDGDDGRWSSFALRIGEPGHEVRVLISTASTVTSAVDPRGCPPGVSGLSNDLNCSQSRGGLFDPSHSSSWSALGNYSLDIEENLGYMAAASYGLDTIALGSSSYTNVPTVKSQVVASLTTSLSYIGLFGLRSQPTNFSMNPTNLTDFFSCPSFLASLKASNLIPSLSWAYTAGAPYRE